MNVIRMVPLSRSRLRPIPTKTPLTTTPTLALVADSANLFCSPCALRVWGKVAAVLQGDRMRSALLVMWRGVHVDASAWL